MKIRATDNRPLRMALALGAILVVSTMIFAACGGSNDNDSDSDTAATTETQTTTEKSTGGSKSASAEGEKIFKDNCSSCHTLAAAGATGTVGPNLDEEGAELSTSEIEARVRDGGEGMPSFKGKLSNQEIDTVATYVHESAKGEGEGESESEEEGE